MQLLVQSIFRSLLPHPSTSPGRAPKAQLVQDVQDLFILAELRHRGVFAGAFFLPAEAEVAGKTAAISIAAVEITKRGLRCIDVDSFRS